MINGSVPFLVVVHPGSACGSLDFNVGPELAELGRIALGQRLESWSGHLVVIHSDLSDELSLSRYREYSSCLELAIDRARMAGHKTLVLSGSDHDLISLAQRAISTLSLIEGDRVVLTGAWIHSTENEYAGCVGGVHEYLRTQGISPEIDPSVLDLDCAWGALAQPEQKQFLFS